MRARIGERDHGARVLDQLQRDVLVLVGDGLEEEHVHVRLEPEVDHGLDGIDAALLGDLRHRAMRPVHALHHMDPLVDGGPRLGADGLAVFTFFRRRHQLLPELGIPQALLLLLQRERAKLAPHRQPVEGELGLEREHRGQGAAVHLGRHAPALGRGVLEQLHVRAPGVRGVPTAEEPEGDGTACLDGQLAQAAVIVGDTRIAGVAVHALAGELEDAGVHVAHHADQPPDLVPRSEPARHGPAVWRLMARRPGGREADGAGLQPAPQLGFHGAEIVLGRRLLEGALAHDIGAQRGVAKVARVVDAFGEPVDGVEELGEGLPLPLDARFHRLQRDVLRALEIADHEVPVFLGAGREGEAAIAHDHGGDAVPAGAGPERIPEHLGVHVGVAVHEAGGDHLTFGVEDLAGGFAYATNGRDAPAAHAHVGPVAWPTGPVHHPAVLDQEVIGHGTLLFDAPGVYRSMLGPWYPSRRLLLQARFLPRFPSPGGTVYAGRAPWTSESSTIWIGGTCRCTSTTRAACACWRSTTRRASTPTTSPSITPRRWAWPRCPGSSSPPPPSARGASASAPASTACRCTIRCGSSRKCACSTISRAAASTSAWAGASCPTRWRSSTSTTSRPRRSTRRR